MSEKNIALTLEGDGISIEKDISRDEFVRIMSIIFTDSTSQGNDKGELFVKEKQNEERLTSISEFMNGLDVKNNFKKIAAIAFYHEEILGNSTINKEIIPEWFRKAGLSVPKNIPRDINTAIKNDLIAEDHRNNDVYYITNTGKEKLKITDS